MCDENAVDEQLDPEGLVGRNADGVDQQHERAIAVVDLWEGDR